MLVEVIVYIAVFVVVIGLALSAFYHFHMQSAYLRRNAEDITRTLKAGERWRDEIRNCSEVEIIAEPNANILRLATEQREILYTFQEGKVWRKELPDGRWVAVLKDVKSSEFQSETEDQVNSWKWELELASQQKIVRKKPLFSFMAVSGRSVSAQ